MIAWLTDWLTDYLHQGDYGFACVCLSAGQLKKLWTNFDVSVAFIFQALVELIVAHMNIGTTAVSDLMECHAIHCWVAACLVVYVVYDRFRSTVKRAFYPRDARNAMFYPVLWTAIRNKRINETNA